MMNWKCLLGHDWEIQRIQCMEEYDSSEDKYPTYYYTDVFHVCKKCQDVKVKRLKGKWSRDDDDDEDKDSSKEDPKCPDEYFDLIEKK